MASEITGNYVLDFVIVQTASLLYLSEAALPLVKKTDSEDQTLQEINSPPIAAWYEKAACNSLKALPGAAKPCMKTTGLSIQVLSELTNIINNYKMQTYLAKPSLHKDWRVIAAISLQFCLEYLEANPCSPEDIAAVLEGGTCFLNAGLQDEDSKDYMPDLKELYDRLIAETDVSLEGTMALAGVLRATAAWHAYNGFNHRDSYITSLALEVLHRKSRTGLFHFSPSGYAPVSLGQQFYILDALIKAYPYIQLESTLEEAFNIFNNLYRIAYKDPYEMFTFRHRSISYTPFDIGALLSCLDSISKYSSEGSEQKAMLERITEDFMNALITSYKEAHKQDISRLIRWICLYRECKLPAESKPVINTIFPKRIYMKYPAADISWNRKGIISQMEVFFLCASMLSLLAKNDTVSNAASVQGMDLPALEALKALFEYFLNR